MKGREKQGRFSTWGELRDHLIDAYGETPHPETEQQIIDAYQLHPDQLENAAHQIAHDVTNGTARSGWGVLRTRANQISRPLANPDRPTSLDREKAIARAEQEIRNAGIHIDRESELILHLFDDRGLLRHYAQATFQRGLNGLTITGDQQLVTRMTTLWQEHRPTGEQLERDAIAAAEKWKAQHTLEQRPVEPPAPSPEPADLPH